jgi:hypothetical protein
LFTLFALISSASTSVQDTARYAEMAAAFVVFAAISISSAGIGLRFAKSSAKETLSDGTASPKRYQNFLWPDVYTTRSAHSAARQAMWAAFCCSGVTALTAFLANNGVTLLGGDTRMAVLRALLYGALAIGIHRMSRSAASLALLIFLLERTQESGPIAMTIILLVCFVNGVRGTVEYHRLAPPYTADARTSLGTGLPRRE